MNKTRISIVLPVYNEENNLEPLITEIDEIMRSINKKFEIICVDDKSSDSSMDVMMKLQSKYPSLRIIHHKVNSGQSAAFVSGFQKAGGELIITMDADGQNNPADIPEMLQKLDNDCDAVCGVRINRQDTFVKKTSSRIANAFRNVITGDRLRDTGCAFRVIRADAVRELPPFNGLHRFIPSILRFQGYKVIEIPVSHRPRKSGVSKYGINNRLFRGIADCFAMRWLKSRSFQAARTSDKA